MSLSLVILVLTGFFVGFLFLSLLTLISVKSDYLPERKQINFNPTYTMRTALLKMKGMKIAGVSYKFC